MIPWRMPVFQRNRIATPSFYRRARNPEPFMHAWNMFAPTFIFHGISITFGRERDESNRGTSGDAASSLISTVIVGAWENLWKNLPRNTLELTENPLLSRESSFPLRRTTELLVPAKRHSVLLSNVRKNRASLTSGAFTRKGKKKVTDRMIVKLVQGRGSSLFKDAKLAVQ